VSLSEADWELLRRELQAAETSLHEARLSSDPLESLGLLTAAVDEMVATQHELVNVLLDRGATWATIASGLSTSSTGAQRRFPRRGGRPEPDS